MQVSKKRPAHSGRRIRVRLAVPTLLLVAGLGLSLNSFGGANDVSVVLVESAPATPTTAPVVCATQATHEGGTAAAPVLWDNTKLPKFHKGKGEELWDLLEEDPSREAALANLLRQQQVTPQFDSRGHLLVDYTVSSTHVPITADNIRKALAHGWSGFYQNHTAADGTRLNEPHFWKAPALMGVLYTQNAMLAGTQTRLMDDLYRSMYPHRIRRVWDREVLPTLDEWIKFQQEEWTRTLPAGASQYLDWNDLKGRWWKEWHYIHRQKNPHYKQFSYTTREIDGIERALENYYSSGLPTQTEWLHFQHARWLSSKRVQARPPSALPPAPEAVGEYHKKRSSLQKAAKKEGAEGDAARAELEKLQPPPELARWEFLKSYLQDRTAAEKASKQSGPEGDMAKQRLAELLAATPPELTKWEAELAQAATEKGEDNPPVDRWLREWRYFHKLTPLDVFVPEPPANVVETERQAVARVRQAKERMVRLLATWQSEQQKAYEADESRPAYVIRINPPNGGIRRIVEESGRAVRGAQTSDTKEAQYDAQGRRVMNTNTWITFGPVIDSFTEMIEDGDGLAIGVYVAKDHPHIGKMHPILNRPITEGDLVAGTYALFLKNDRRVPPWGTTLYMDRAMINGDRNHLFFNNAGRLGFLFQIETFRRMGLNKSNTATVNVTISAFNGHFEERSAVLEEARRLRISQPNPAPLELPADTLNGAPVPFDWNLWSRRGLERYLEANMDPSIPCVGQDVRIEVRTAEEKERLKRVAAGGAPAPDPLDED